MHGGAGAVLIFPSNFNQSLTDSISVAATVLFQMCLLAVPTFGETPTRSSDDVLALGVNVRGAIPRWHDSYSDGLSVRVPDNLTPPARARLTFSM